MRIFIILILFLTTQSITFAVSLEGRYWFDNNVQSAKPISVSRGNNEIILPGVEFLNKGVHVLNLQIKNENGDWSPVHSDLFSLCSESPLELSYMIDGVRYDSPLERESLVDVAEIANGLHFVSLYDQGGHIPMTTSIFYKSPVIKDKMILVVENHDRSFQRRLSIPEAEKFLDLDVKELPFGVNFLNLMLISSDKPDEDNILALQSALIYKNIVGDNGITDLYYWVDNDFTTLQRIKVKEGNYPYTCSEDFVIPDMDIPIDDYTLYVGDDVAHIAPIYDIYVATRDKLDNVTTSKATFTDCARKTVLEEPVLEHSRQQDFDSIDIRNAYWAKFYAREGDEIEFNTRRECYARFYDVEGSLSNEKEFTEDELSMRLNIDKSGMNYVQFNNIAESKQLYSLKMKYLSGPTADSLNQVPDADEFDGYEISWTGLSDWDNSIDNEMSIYNHGIRLTVRDSQNGLKSYLTEVSRSCYIPEESVIEFTSDEDMDQILFVMSDNYAIPDLDISEGSLSIDTINYRHNILVWNGKSKNVSFRIKENFLSALSHGSEIPTSFCFDRAYVTLNTLVRDGAILEKEEYSDVVYSDFTHVNIWNKTGLLATHSLSDDLKIELGSQELTLSKDGSQYSYDDDHIMLTFEYRSDVSNIENGEDMSPGLWIENGNLIFRGLPAEISIYTVSGVVIFHDYIQDDDFRFPVDELENGVYIIKIGKTAVKILL